MDLGDAKITISAEDKASAKLDSISNKINGMSTTFIKAGGAMMGAGVVLGGGLLALAKGAADFDMKMREVNTMIGLSETQFQALSDEVKELSSDVGIAAGELSGALYQIVSAGVDSAEAIDVLTVASKAAVAGVTDVETAADGLTTVLNAFKIPASEATNVADIMFTVVKRGKTTFEELSASMFQVAPIAAAAGVKFGEVAAAIATITKQGVPTAVATTQLRATIQAIIKPTEDMSAALQDMGYKSGEAMIQEEGLSGALNLLTDHVGGSLEPLGKMFGSVEALGAVLSLTGENASTFADDLKATTEDAAGSVETAYEEMNEGVGRQFEKLFNDIKELGIEIGEAILPILKEIIEKLKPIIEKFKEWVTANTDLFPTLLKLAGILVGVGGVVVAIGMVAKAIAAVNTALAIMHGLSGPAGWAKLAAGAAVSATAIAGMAALMPDFDFGTSPRAKAQTELDALVEEFKAEGYTIEEIREMAGGNLPGYEYGGIVPGPIGQPVPVIAHGGEQFLGVGNTTGSTINISMGSFLGDDASLRKFARVIKGIIGEDNRRNSFGQVNRGYFYGRSSL